MKITLISPRLAIQKGDFLGSGVPYWPIELATFASYLRLENEDVHLIDLFGQNCRHLSDMGDHFLQGEPLESHIESELFISTKIFILYAISYMSHRELLSIVGKLKERFPGVPIAILENSQAVTAYSLQRVAAEFLKAGADVLICGEPYFNWPDIKRQLAGEGSKPIAQNLITSETGFSPERITKKNASYPIPAWDLINLKGYWGLPYSHGPKTAKFLPVITSRGCPYPCDFCVVPETNQKRWRGNSPKDVVEELIALRDRFGVYDFQIEDLNPTVQHERWEKICTLLIEKQVNIRFYFVSGTKAETIHIETISLFAKAGCRFVSISPESGSETLMRTIGKRFDYNKGIELIAACRIHGIRTQACLLVGHPAETEGDYLASKRYLIQMIKAGLDEVAVFIVAPFAGSSLFAKSRITMNGNVTLASFSPKGRTDYRSLDMRRRGLIRTFFIQKLLMGKELFLQSYRSMFGTPQTKMENLPRRILYIYWLVIRHNFLKKFKCQ